MIKTAAHLHSNYSYDGKLSLAALRALLQKSGIQCALMTEHTDDFTKEKAVQFAAECAAESTPDFLFIPGYEVPHGQAHLLMLGSSYIESADLREWKSSAAYCVLAHPHRNRYVLDNAMREAADAIEVWNSQYDGKHSPRPRAERLLLEEGKKKALRAWAGWDLHREAHAGGPWLLVDAPELSVQAVLQALHLGHFRIGTQAGSRMRGLFDRTTIALGRNTNALLSLFGLTLPTQLAASVRSKI